MSTGFAANPVRKLDSDVRFGVLGELTVIAGTALHLGGPKQRTVLAMLIAHADHPVSVDSIIEAVWGDDAAPNARRIVQTYVATLRGELGDVIVKSGSGWRLDADRELIDACRFEDLYGSARDVVDTNPQRASVALREALAMWRGHPYADVEAHGFLDGEISRLTELRSAAQATRIEADLALGRDADLVGEIEALMAEHPYSERFRAQAMLALYRAGRQQEALRSYQHMRGLLLEELGVDPTPELQELERRILDQDESLRLAPAQTIQRRAVLVADPGDPIEIGHMPAGKREDLLLRTTRALRSAIDREDGGHTITAGTTTYVIFDSVLAAANVAEAVTRRLDGEAMRFAIDWGDVVLENGRVSGAPVSRAAVLAAVAHSGQTLLSAEAQQSVANSGSGRGIRFENLGSYDLYGVEGSLLVYQLLIGDIPPVFPELETHRLPPPLPGGGDRSVPGYELREAIAPGSIGTLYRAFQPSVGREVLIEVIERTDSSDVDFIRNFEADAQRLSLLDHQNIAPLVDYWRQPDGAFLVYRYPRGGLLSQRATGVGQRLVDQIGSALGYAHSLGMIHGSVRPDRIALDEAGNGSLLCFPVAGIAPEPSEEYRQFLAPEVGQGERATVASDIYSLAVLAWEFGASDPVLDRATHPDPALRPRTVAQFLRELSPGRAGSSSDRLTEVRNPYKGLTAFHETDAADFFGRSAATEELCRALATSNLLAIVGPSGIGKSSVARAGLVPALRSGRLPGSETWLVTDMLPGSHPFLELQRALARVSVALPVGLTEALAAQDCHALEHVADVLPDQGDLVVLIDQFEELFTMTGAAERQAFLDLIETSIEARWVRFVLTLRADFFDRPLLYAGFGKLLKTSTVMLTSPTPGELAEAINMPAQGVGVEVAPELVERMVGEVRDQPGALPLLQHTLAELFTSRRSDLIGIGDFEERGGVRGSLAKRAESIHSRLSDADTTKVKQLFLRLVAIVDENSPTRRRVRVTEVADLEVEEAIEAFVRSRLLVLDSEPETRIPTIEVSHEALLTYWPRFAGWIDSAREDLTMVRRLEESRREWEGSGRDDGYLLTRGRLAQHQAWTATTMLALSEPEREYLTASRRYDERIKKRSRRRRNFIMGGFATAAVVAMILAGAALWQRGIAQEEARQEEARRLAASSTLALDEDPERAILLALEAVEVGRRAGDQPRPEAVAALHEAVQTSRIEMRLTNDTAVGFGTNGELVTAQQADQIAGVLPPVAVLSPDGRYFAERVISEDPTTSDQLGEIVVWDAATRNEVVRLEPRSSSGQRMYVGLSVQWDPGGWKIAAQVIDNDTDESQIRLWEVPSGNEVASFNAFSGNNASFAFIDSQTLAAPDPAGDGVLFYDIETGQVVDVLYTLGHKAQYIAHDPMRNWFVIGSQQSEAIQAWDLDSKERLWSTDIVGSFWPTIHSDSGMVAVGGWDATIRLLDVRDGSELTVLRGHTAETRGALFSPEGESLVSRTVGETLVWDLFPAGPSVVGVVDLGSPTPFDLTLSPEGDEVAVLVEGSLLRYDLGTGQPTGVALTSAMIGAVSTPPVSSDWRLVAALDDEERGWIYELETLNPVMELPPCTRPKNFNTAGTAVIVEVIEDCGTLPDTSRHSRVIAVPSGEELLDLGEDHVYDTPGGVFNPGGAFEADRYVAVNRGTGVDIYDFRDGRLLSTLDRPSEGALGMAFDSTGRYLAVGGGGIAWVIDMEQVVAGIPAEQALIFDDPVNPGGVPAVDITRGGVLATSGFGWLRLWDIATSEQIVQIPVDSTVSSWAVFTSTGDELLYIDQAESGYVLRRFHLDPDELIELAETRVTRELTAEECRRYELGVEACGSPSS